MLRHQDLMSRETFAYELFKWQNWLKTACLHSFLRDSLLMKPKYRWCIFARWVRCVPVQLLMCGQAGCISLQGVSILVQGGAETPHNHATPRCHCHLQVQAFTGGWHYASFGHC